MEAGREGVVEGREGSEGAMGDAGSKGMITRELWLARLRMKGRNSSSLDVGRAGPSLSGSACVKGAR